ncbi:hypothetical protein ACTXOR_10600 [Arthrobacter rhombi]|uniref:hypothetical protein n=1 Tax=Arthrobacter rhombi TaxID=71253 RepID=UPI003FCF7130
MEHKLRVLVRLDVKTTNNSTHAVLDVGGCLTSDSCEALFPIIRRTRSLIEGLSVLVDLSEVGHIDDDGLAVLQEFIADGRDVSVSATGSGGNGSVEVIVPAVLPTCGKTAGGSHRTEETAA